MSSIITLTTDFGEKDYYRSAVIGRLYTLLGNPDIVDISHQITPFDIQEAAYILGNAYIHFPKNTIHIVGIDTIETSEKAHLVVACDGHYFIAADNGILSIFFRELSLHPTNIIEISNQPPSSFVTLDVFCKVAAHLANGYAIAELGAARKQLKERRTVSAVIQGDDEGIIGQIIYIDHYGNGVTNIDRALFTKVGKGRPHELQVRGHFFRKIYDNFVMISQIGFAENGRAFFVYNNNEKLTIAICRGTSVGGGNASSLLGLNRGTPISITF